MSYELKKMSRPTTRNSQQIRDEESESESDESDTELLKDSRKIQESVSKNDESDTRLPKDLQETKEGESKRDRSDTQLPKDLPKTKEDEIERHESDARLPKDLEETEEGEGKRDISDRRLPKNLEETKEGEIERDESDARLPKHLEETKIFPMSYELQKVSRQTSRNTQQICDEILQLLVELQKKGESHAGHIQQIQKMMYDSLTICEQDTKSELQLQIFKMHLELQGKDKPDVDIINNISEKISSLVIDLMCEVDEESESESEIASIDKEFNNILLETEESESESEIASIDKEFNNIFLETERSVYRPTVAVGLISARVKDSIRKQRHLKTEDGERELPTENEGDSKAIDVLFKNESEETVLRVFNDRIDTDTILYRDESGRTLLHRAVENNFLSVADLFIVYGINPMSYDSSKRTPLHTALDNGYDEMAALIISKLPNFVVRRMFGDIKSKGGRLEAGTMKEKLIEKGQDNTNDDAELCGTYDEHTVEPMFKIKKLITKDLDKTLLQVLDSFVEEQPCGLSNVHVKLLDTDDDDREPNDENFNFENHTAFQSLTCSERKDALNHPVVRVYMEHKWRHWCQKRFLFYGCLYLFSLFCLTYSAVTGVTASDLYTYDTRLQRSRAVTEVISYIYALAVLFTEIRQILRHRRSYFAYFFNFMEFFSAILILLVLPLRYTHLIAHWYVFALGYFLWAIRIFKYATVFSQSGVYVEVIKQILVQDFVQFSILLLVINTIFSGTFLLVLKADDSLNTHVDTSSFFGVLYVGVRTLIEAGPIVDYTGSDGYRVVGTIIMLVYMFFTIVVMLNILIAQLSETYNRTYKDCIKTVRANRALIIARAERNHWRLQPSRWDWTKYYISEINDVDMKKNKKDFSTLDVLSRKIDIIQKKQLKIGLDVQTMKS